MENKNYRILVVDDEIEYQTVFSIILRKKGYTVDTCSGGKEALEFLENNEIDLVMTDLKMPEMDGIELVKKVKEKYSDIDIHVMTAFGTIETAVTAMKYGATGYSVKSSEPDALLAEIERMAKLRMLEKENSRMSEEADMKGEMFLTSKSPAFQEVLEICEKASTTDISVLILGESGVGKEVISRYIHKLSNRNNNPFIPVNCQVFGEGTLESELFGHEKGSFTGASEKRIGRFESANCGTLFLDEIGDIPMSLQGKILRVLENKEIERVGSNKAIATDFRLISATNKNIEKEIEEGLFREDLLYRINTLTVTIPPLRERKEDIPDLIQFFVRKICAEQKKCITSIEPWTEEFLLTYDYPGNIRELRNLLERMVALSDDGVLKMKGFTKKNCSETNCEEGIENTVLPLREARGMFEKEHIERALKKTDGNVAAAAELLEITKRQLWNKISDYDIKK